MIIRMPRSLAQPIAAQATGFFLSKYILGSKFEYLPSLYKPHSDIEGHLSACIEAVGLASLSNELNSLEIAKEAKTRYVLAIRATNAALLVPSRAMKDSTLLSVLLLGLFEAITCTKFNLCSWESHIKGAIALIQLRGRQQVESQLGLQLLNQTTTSAAVAAHRSMAEIPTEIISLVTHGLQYASMDDPSWSFRLILFRSANFRAAIKSGILSDPDVIIVAAKGLDHDFVAWSRTLPSSWQFETYIVEQVDPTTVYEGYYHLYHAQGIAQNMNAWRMARLQLNEIIWEQVFRQEVSPLDSEDSATLILQVGSNITGLCSEICATVPQYVELPAKLPMSLGTRQPSRSNTHNAPLPMAKSSRAGFTHSARGYGIIWPLMVVANCVIPHSPRRAWVVNRLQYIGRQMKNPQARLALEILEWKEDIGKRYLDVFLKSCVPSC